MLFFAVGINSFQFYMPHVHFFINVGDLFFYCCSYCFQGYRRLRFIVQLPLFLSVIERNTAYFFPFFSMFIKRNYIQISVRAWAFWQKAVLV